MQGGDIAEEVQFGLILVGADGAHEAGRTICAAFAGLVFGDASFEFCFAFGELAFCIDTAKAIGAVAIVFTDAKAKALVDAEVVVAAVFGVVGVAGLSGGGALAVDGLAEENEGVLVFVDEGLADVSDGALCIVSAFDLVMDADLDGDLSSVGEGELALEALEGFRAILVLGAQGGAVGVVGAQVCAALDALGGVAGFAGLRAARDGRGAVADQGVTAGRETEDTDLLRGTISVSCAELLGLCGADAAGKGLPGPVWLLVGELTTLHPDRAILVGLAIVRAVSVA